MIPYVFILFNIQYIWNSNNLITIACRIKLAQEILLNIKSTLTNASNSFLAHDKATRIDSDALRAIISFINTNKTISQFKHIVPKAAQGRKHTTVSIRPDQAQIY